MIIYFFGVCTSPAITFPFAIYWIRKDAISKIIGYEWCNVLSLIPFILLLFGRPFLSFYFYLIVSVGMSFSIAYSNSFFFTKLVLALMSYFLIRVFDKEALLGNTLKNSDESVKRSIIKIKEKSLILRYIFFFVEVDPEWTKKTFKFCIGKFKENVFLLKCAKKSYTIS